MFEGLSNDDISNALAELTTCLAVKEETHVDELRALLRKKDVEGCVQGIATRLGLPILRISLSYVPKEFRPDFTDGFRSTALARTDWTGHGMEDIPAQVLIPEYLPMFGRLISRGIQYEFSSEKTAQKIQIPSWRQWPTNSHTYSWHLFGRQIRTANGTPILFLSSLASVTLFGKGERKLIAPQAETRRQYARLRTGI